MRAFSYSLVAALLVAGVATPAAAEAASLYRLDVGLVPGADVPAVLAKLDGQPTGRPVPGLDAITVDVPTSTVVAAVATLSADPAVRYAERDAVVHADADPNESSNRASTFYNQVPVAWTWSTGSPSVTVAVVDTGVTANGDLAVDRIAPGYDFVDDDADPADDDNHGTMVANSIAAQPGNRVGGVGVCGQCRIMPVRVLGHQTTGVATGYASDVAAGIVWAADHGAQIVNLSLSTAIRSRLLEDAVGRASAQGALVVASAGNSAGTGRQYPAAIEPALAVGAAGYRGIPLSRTSVNPPTDKWIDLAAYNSMLTLDATSQSRWLSGTSASTAIASGVAALGLAMKPGISSSDLRSAIIGTAGRDAPMESYDPPVLDAAALLHGFGGTDKAAPRVTSTSLADGQLIGSSTQSPTASVTDDHGVQRFELEVNGQVTERSHVWSQQFLLTPPKDQEGELSFTIRAYDYAGHMGEKTTTVRFDSIAPTGTVDAPAEGTRVRSGPLDVVFTSATDEKLRNVQANEVALRQVSARRWEGQATPQADGTIFFNVFDMAGNLTDLRRTVVIDDVAPTGWIDSPATGAHIRGAADVAFTSTAGEELSGVRANGVALKKISAYHWQGRAIPTAAGVLEVIATDLAGNARGFVRKVVVDNAGPVVKTMSPAWNARVRGTFYTSLSGVTDASGVAMAQLWANGVYIGADRTAPYGGWVKTGTRSGAVTLTWRLTDTLGNVRTLTRPVIADNAGPSVTIRKAPGNQAKVKGVVKVSVSASDPSGVGRVELIVNGKVVARDYTSAYELSVNTAKLAKTMRVQVRAYDKLGNVRYTATRTWYRK